MQDTTIADLAVGLCTGQIKTGAPCRSDRNVTWANQVAKTEYLSYDDWHARLWEDGFMHIAPETLQNEMVCASERDQKTSSAIAACRKNNNQSAAHLWP